MIGSTKCWWTKAIKTDTIPCGSDRVTWICQFDSSICSLFWCGCGNFEMKHDSTYSLSISNFCINYVINRVLRKQQEWHLMKLPCWYGGESYANRAGPLENISLCPGTWNRIATEDCFLFINGAYRTRNRYKFKTCRPRGVLILRDLSRQPYGRSISTPQFS